MSNSNGMPFIKREDDFSSDPNRFMMASNTYGSRQQQNFSNQYNSQGMNSVVNPAEISMQNGGFSMNNPFGSQQNLSSSYNMGGSGFNDNELLDSLDFNGPDMMNDFSTMQQNQNNNNRHPSGISMSQSNQISNIYSSTPDGMPIQSPFLGTIDYSQFKPFNSIPQHMSPQGPQMHHKRPSIQSVHRKSSEQRTPMTPKTAAAMAGLQIGTPESGSFPNGRPIRTPSLQNRHAKTLSAQYDSTPGSLHSFLESPISSPGHPSHHTGIGETLGKHSSLPTKSEHETSGHSAESVEAKKRRRRASHNAVERRRRDNINDRIQEMAHLVPEHRLNDDKVKKLQAQSNSPLSPTLGAVSMSPPNAANAATSLLAGAAGRRAASTAGNITIGLPIDEKEKGPNKGDILNGSVAFMRDMVWALYNQYQREDDLADKFAQLGGVWPYERTEDEKRFRTELMYQVEKNDPSSFSYSRTHGSGLHVPGHTNIAGEPIHSNSNTSPQSMLELSPGFRSGGSGTNSGSAGAGQPQFWDSAGHPGISFKEEDEFMDM